jgi:hypothetical protein
MRDETACPNCGLEGTEGVLCVFCREVVDAQRRVMEGLDEKLKREGPPPGETVGEARDRAYQELGAAVSDLKRELSKTWAGRMIHRALDWLARHTPG